MKKYNLATTLILLASCFGLSAQTETIYERESTYLENTVPPSPEPASIVKYADVPFNPSSGMAEYEVPFYTLQGRELNIPIGLRYASSGIKLDEIAGVAGLGWTLQAGGCITRTVVDMPDEYSSHIFEHRMPSGSLLDSLVNCVEDNQSLNYLTRVLRHTIDASLDRYSYSVCGLSGSFVINDDGSIFQLSGSGVLISYTRDTDGAVDAFTVTGPDGTVYTFSEKEIATHKGSGITPPPPTGGEPDRWSATTAWHLTTVRSRSGLETAQFSYSSPTDWLSRIRSIRNTVAVTCGENGAMPTTDLSTHHILKSHSVKVLTAISLSGTTATFSYAGGCGNVTRTNRTDITNFPYRLTEISINTEGNSSVLARMEVQTQRDGYDGRITLNGLRLYRAGTLDDKWEFTYRGVGKSVSTGSQDWYGFYNGEKEFTDKGTDGVGPYEYNITTGGLDLTNGFPASEYADYMSLTSVNHDGAITNFYYEGSIYKSGNEAYSIGTRVRDIVLTDNPMPTQVRHFTYEDAEASGHYEPMPMYYTTVSMKPRSYSESDTIAVQVADWTYTFHDTPVTLGPSIRDTRIYYGKVTEDVGKLAGFYPEGTLPNGNTARTVYQYDVDDVKAGTYDQKGRFPSEWRGYYDGTQTAPEFCSPWNGVRTFYCESGPSAPPFLIRKEVYAYEDGAYRLKESTDIEYDETDRGTVLIDYHAEQISDHPMIEGNPYYEYIFHYPVYARSYAGRNPVRETKVGYHPSGNDITVVNTLYVNRPDLSSPVRVSSESTSEGQITRTVSYTYADTWNQGGWVQDLRSQHCLSLPLKTSLKYGYASSQATVFKEEVNEYAWTAVDGVQRLLPSVHKENHLGTESWRETFLTRDCKGNISSVKEKGRPETVIIWSWSGRYPAAVIENSTMTAVASALGGQAAVNSLTRAASPSQSQLATLSALRNTLTSALVTTYTVLPGIGITSVTDPAGQTTTFEYDNAGRLTCIRNHDGRKVQEHEYALMIDSNKRRHIKSRVFRNEDGTQYAEDVRWWDAFGRISQEISIAASGDGKDLVTAYEGDFLMHEDVNTWLPYPEESTGGAFQTGAAGKAAESHSNQLAYAARDYEMSSRDKINAEALPGYDGTHYSTISTDAVYGFPIYEWDGYAIMQKGTYGSSCIVVEKTTDADGRFQSIFRDHSGKTLATSNGNDPRTYYIYDRYDRLRTVKSSGIAISDTLDMWRYSYDALGRLSSKGIPGAVREYYSYDSEDRLVSVLRDGVLKEMEYDAMNRVTKVYLSKDGGQRVLMEQHTYDTYPSGVTGANPKGLRTASRLAEIGPDGGVTGFADVRFVYDDRKRPVQTQILYRDGSILSEQTEYGFAGEVISSLYTYSSGGNVIGRLLQNYTYDNRGRICSETATLYKSVGQNVSALKRYVYDDLGRVSRIAIEVPGGVCLNTDMDYTLQGWVSSLETSTDGEILFAQNLGYDSGNILSGTEPSYTGLITRKDDTWFQDSQVASMLTNGYAYDYAGRLASEVSADMNATDYEYDARGNVKAVRIGQEETTFTHSGDILTSVTGPDGLIKNFSHDVLGRMTYDGTTDQSMTYNILDLVGKVSKGGAALANYSYLADGTKVSALNGGGEGLMYRGPFVYRKSSGSSSLTLESAVFGGGRLTPSGAMLYVTDYLGSVRAVVNGSNGAICKASDYSPYGEQSDAESMQTASTPAWITLRDAYTGKEDQHPDFGTGYTDFGARQYSPALRRWMAPDPLSEKYYGISPYAFCNNNPVNFVDPDGMKWKKDKAAGYGIGLLTNLVPFSGFLRDKYSPDDPSDYNIALRNVDLTVFTVGESLTKAGGTMLAGGGAIAAVGATMAVTTVGTTVAVAGPVAIVGADVAATGAAATGVGLTMMANSTANQSQGYERGKTKSETPQQEYTFTQGRDGKFHTVTTKIPEGYKKVKGLYPHGKPVFYNGKNYITPDRDGHNGGVWKMAKKEKDLYNRNTRMGTYDAELNKIGD